MDETIERLIDHLWLQDRLSANTLAAYRRDLEKTAARLSAQGKGWLDAQSGDLAAAVYRAEESPRSQARALSACKRLYGWLLDTGQTAADPTEHLRSPK
ncbi:TPA: site-specific integrase, partial [Neisseria bacilliformis]